MARRYTRDNRGRFASGGGGATARGGRLRTAAGNKRATQTMKAAGGGGDGVIRGRAARTVAGQKVMGKLAKRPEPAKAAPKAAPQRIEGPMRTGGTRSRLSGRKMSEGAGKRGKAREERQAAMAGMRQMLGRVKPAQSAEPLSTGGTLRARASLTRARAKAGAEGASSAQRGAATRANTYAKASVQRNTVRMKAQGAGGAGVMKGAVKRDPGAMAKAGKAAPAIQASGRTRAQAAKAQKARNKRVADYAEYSVSLNPRVSRNSRVTEEGRYAETVGRPVIARRKYSQPNIFGGTDRVAGSSRARLVGTRERGQSGVIPLAARALPIKGRGRAKPRPYGSR